MIICRLPVTSGQCLIGKEKHPDAGFFLKDGDDDDYCRGYAQIKESFRAQTQNVILQAYISAHDFASTDVNDAGENNICIGYNLNVFDKRYQKDFTVAQPIKLERKLDGVIPADVYGFALVITNKLVSISSDGKETLI